MVQQIYKNCFAITVPQTILLNREVAQLIEQRKMDLVKILTAFKSFGCRGCRFKSYLPDSW